MTRSIPSREQIGIFPLGDGLTMEWQKNGRIVVFVWHSVSRETVDIFAEAYRTILRNWPTQEPLLQLNDLRFAGFAFTPYLRNIVQQVIKEALALGISGRVANVMTAGLTMRIVQLFLRVAVVDPRAPAQIFADVDKAIIWLDAAPSTTSA